MLLQQQIGLILLAAQAVLLRRLLLTMLSLTPRLILWCFHSRSRLALVRFAETSAQEVLAVR
jgi:hypothetical protein